MGNFRRIYPAVGTEKYEKFFHSSGTLFQETAAFKARSELARYLLEFEPCPEKTGFLPLRKTKVQISCAVTAQLADLTAQLINTFIFATWIV